MSEDSQTNFGETEERTMLKDTLRRFLSDIYTDEMRINSSSCLEENSDGIWSQLAELGVLHVLFAEDVGGLGGHGFDIVTVFEELGRAGAMEPLLVNTVLAGGLIADLGTSDQKALLQQVMSGEYQLAFAHSEPGSRYDLSHVTTTATAEDNGFVLAGRKAVVSNAIQAQTLIVSARTNGATGSQDGVSLFLVPADMPGVSMRGYPTIDGGHAAEVELANVRLPANTLLGEPGCTFPAIEARVSMAIAAISAEALGAMEVAKEITIGYLQTRTQFGRPIGEFQVLQHRMANMLIEIEQARSAVLNLAAVLDKPRIQRERNASATKNLIGRTGRLVAEECIQLHGGIGMAQEYAISHFARRLIMVDHEFGDTDHHLERFIALSQVEESIHEP